MRGRFLALEGIDGCGKSTQINYLSKWLPKSGLMPNGSNLYITREPGGTDLGQLLRDLLLKKSSPTTYPEPITELLLYAADRAQHITQVIQPKIEQGHWVISDRFSGSTIAYQGYGRELNLNIIKNLETIATQGLMPDLTLLLDLPTSESIKRRNSQSKDRIEQEGQVFLEKVALGFQELAKNPSWLIINGHQKEELVSKEIKEKITLNLKLYK